ncbi:cell death abnormality protein 1-like [Haliotis rubra]|uniref:cell death abnormality protein 1-like n=1 Tax=Haliotis rubra TaxID=36100 RepID=UPI001EE58D28|nr:cell death abnormality protein 1-like [Haliotis rubra]
MSFLVFLTFACLILSTPADHCHKSQHCSNCDPASGNCITECETGYYDLKCKSECSKNCKEKKCKLLENTGIGNCTEGCEPGYHGVNCKLICPVPTQNCSKCPGGCDGEYCQDSYYGSACKDCSKRCQSCNRITGTCDQCHSDYHGKNCEYSCNYCSGSCVGECARVCAPGLYGTECAEMCSENCLPNPVFYSEGQCVEEDGNITNECTPECHNESGQCIHGCVAGWYGPMCEFQCNSNCFNKQCDNTSACDEGCTAGHFGKDCIPCSDICASYTCKSNNGSCLHNCNSEVYGQFCNLTNKTCIDDVCAQITDKCIKECTITEEGCMRTCSEDIPTTECSDESCVTGKSASGINLYAVSLIAALFVAVAGCCICYRRGLTTTRNNQQGESEHGAGTPQEERGEYEALHRYCEIRETDMDKESETSNSQEIGQEMAPAFPVLAGCSFQTRGTGLADGDANITGISSGATETDTAIDARYVSPVADD